jgi:elongation factor P hydroxylase
LKFRPDTRNPFKRVGEIKPNPFEWVLGISQRNSFAGSLKFRPATRNPFKRVGEIKPNPFEWVLGISQRNSFAGSPGGIEPEVCIEAARIETARIEIPAWYGKPVANGLGKSSLTHLNGFLVSASVIHSLAL